jgi:hypothetical protein
MYQNEERVGHIALDITSNASPAIYLEKKGGHRLGLVMSSLRGGHANLLCIISNFSDALLDAWRYMRGC